MPVIDRTAFEELEQISGADFINELIDAFLDDAPKMIKEMEIALTSRDPESLRRNAHSLKSNADTFGATELAGVAKELEVMARENNLEIGDRLENLRDALQKAGAELEAMRT
ncbi:MAG: Hpt domain-containing protein [Chloroflexota bacterium]|nr:Hpt domain-containing protein [Chloroflexota bacterium]